MSPNPGKPEGGQRYTLGPAARNKALERELDQAQGAYNITYQAYLQVLVERDQARAERDHALDLCERARATAQRYEEELALIRRAATARRHG